LEPDFVRQYLDLRSNEGLDDHDGDMTARFTKLFATTTSPYSRASYPDHITASALVIHPESKRVLFTFHKKAQRWLQLGGHADENETSPDQAALRECREESGLNDLKAFAWKGQIAPIDLDVHAIPGWAKEPPHYHYDVRYLFATQSPAKIAISDESEFLRWFTFAEARELVDESSILRLLDKTERLMKLKDFEDRFIL
jgi:8-oxo-dGTP pyrophosphatase MutT (NUDIX family)